MQAHSNNASPFMEVVLNHGTVVLIEFGDFQPTPDGRMDVPWRYKFLERGDMDFEAVETALEELIHSAKLVQVSGEPGVGPHADGNGLH